jgi:hypothetical protein
MTSEGQALALEQLREIATQSDGVLEIVLVKEPAAAGDSLTVEISLDCRPYKQISGGVKLRARERLVLTVGALFPFRPPQLDFGDDRYAGTPHVQWGRHVCLYQATDIEWQPDDGMYGFMQRVHEWLTAAAADELDPIGGPLHPPAVYSSGGPIVVPTVDTPAVTPPWWAGYALITREEEHWIELGLWVAYDAEIPEGRYAPAILLPNDMPFEYPTSVSDLRRVLSERSISFSLIRTLLELGALRASAGEAIYFVLGAAMRGVAGSDRVQHVACWSVDSARADELRASISGPDGKETRDQHFESWAATAKIDWCQVHEQRPEIVTPRDAGSDVAWWRGRHVAILGCGAIGSAIAMLLGRAGVAKMQL